MRTIFTLALSLIFLVKGYSQNDDVYYTPGDPEPKKETKQSSNNNNYDDDYGSEDSYYEDEYYSESQTTTDENGNTYINNYYYGDYNDYSTRLRRFYDPYYGFSYYSPAYTGVYFDSWGGWGWSVSLGWGYPNYWDPWYYHYYPWYGHHHHYYPYSYGHGYNHGYWHGYHDGYYGNGYPYGYGYGNDYPTSGRGDYYYGPRFKTSGTSGNNAPRSTGVKKTTETPVNRDAAQPTQNAPRGVPATEKARPSDNRVIEKDKEINRDQYQRAPDRGGNINREEKNIERPQNNRQAQPAPQRQERTTPNNRNFDRPQRNQDSRPQNRPQSRPQNRNFERPQNTAPRNSSPRTQPERNIAPQHSRPQGNAPAEQRFEAPQRQQQSEPQRYSIDRSFDAQPNPNMGGSPSFDRGSTAPAAPQRGGNINRISK